MMATVHCMVRPSLSMHIISLDLHVLIKQGVNGSGRYFKDRIGKDFGKDTYSGLDVSPFTNVLLWNLVWRCVGPYDIVA